VIIFPFHNVFWYLDPFNVAGDVSHRPIERLETRLFQSYSFPAACGFLIIIPSGPWSHIVNNFNKLYIPMTKDHYPIVPTQESVVIIDRSVAACIRETLNGELCEW
jgi:hypothetical protein